jgi:hypothetical protein
MIKWREMMWRRMEYAWKREEMLVGSVEGTR